MLQRIVVVLVLLGLAAMLVASGGPVTTGQGQGQRPTDVPRGQGPPTHHIPPKCYGAETDGQGRVRLWLAPSGQGCP